MKISVTHDTENKTVSFSITDLSYYKIHTLRHLPKILFNEILKYSYVCGESYQECAEELMGIYKQILEKQIAEEKSTQKKKKQ